MRRRAVWIVLGLWFAAHAALNLIFPIAATGDSLLSANRLVTVGMVGAGFAPTVLLAIAAVIAPVPAFVRVPGTIVLTTLLAYTIAFGNLRVDPSTIAYVLIYPLLYTAYLLPAFVAARLRRWRVVPTLSGGRLIHGQFSLYGLLVAVTVVALTLAIGRWIAMLGQWPATWADWGRFVMQMNVDLVPLTVGCLPVLACTAFVLSPGSRGRLALACSGSLAAGLAVSVLSRLALSRVFPIPVYFEYFVLFACHALGLYGSAVVSLLVVRWCGFRLVRDAARPGSDV